MASKSFINERHAFDFMVYILDHKDVKASDLQSLIKNWKTISDILNELVDWGLIEESREKSRKRVVLYNCTQMGEILTLMFKKMDCVVQGDAKLDDIYPYAEELFSKERKDNLEKK